MATINNKHKTKNLKARFFKRNNNQKTTKVADFPSISRSIPAKSLFSRISWKWIWLGIIVLLFASMFVVSGMETYKHFQDKKLAEAKRQELLLKVKYWEGVVSKYKNYRDGYFQLAVLEYQLNDIKNAKKYLDQVFLLDPNFEEGRKLEKVVSSK